MLSTGVTLPCTVQGTSEGQAVVLLHAWGETRRSFDRVMPLMPRTVHVVVPDQRGHGDAPAPPDGYTLVEAAQDVVALLDALGLPSAVLVGSSSGGYVAQQVAVAHPERVDGLVLVGAPLNLHGRPSFASEIEALRDPVDRAWVEASLSWFPLHHDVPSWFLADRVDDGARLPAHVWRDVLVGLTSATPPTEAGRLAMPTLVLWGDRDELISRSDAEALAAASPDSRLHVYPDTGHLVLWEQPERVAADVLGLLRGLPARPAREDRGR